MKQGKESFFTGNVIRLGARQILIRNQLAFGTSDTTLLEGVDRATKEVFGVKHFSFSKESDDQAQKKFWREAESLHRLSDHPSFLNYFASTCFHDKSSPAGWIVMELARGGTLADLFRLMWKQEERHEKKMPLITIAHIMRALLCGISKLEEVELIHCNLQPKKILFSCPSEAPLQFCSGQTSAIREEHVRISGLSGIKTVPELLYMPDHDTLPGLYAAPEKVSSCEPKKRVLYSLGIILHQLIIGNFPEPLLDVLRIQSSLPAIQVQKLHEAKQKEMYFDFPPGQIEPEKEDLLHNFVRGLTQQEPQKRINTKQALNLLEKLEKLLTKEIGNVPLEQTQLIDFDPSRRVAVIPGDVKLPSSQPNKDEKN